MATDIARILANLLAFYDLSGKSVVAVGAGGGQLAGYGRVASRVIAVDRDHAAMEQLRTAVAAQGLDGRFEFWAGDFLACDRSADVVLFEFSLHEIADPAAALSRATRLAPDLVVLDHEPGSPWIYYGAEDDKVERSWRAVEGLPVARRVRYDTEQRFADFEALHEKLHLQGDESFRRIERYRGRHEIVIPMSYALALVAGNQPSPAGIR